MSVYPNNLDTTFPGYPYTDYLEYVDAAQANAWCQASIAIETTLGYGASGTPQNPLYSQYYNTIFPTVAARITNLEGIVYGWFTLNTADNLIQSVGTQNKAGNSGKAADASHVHAQLPVPQGSYVPISGVIGWPGDPATFPSPYYAQCNGQLLSIATYPQLYAVIGTKYGSGSGTFALPNYNGLHLVGVGNQPSGPSGPAGAVGVVGGSRTITIPNLPAHSHPDLTGHDHESWIHDGASDAGDHRYQGIYLDPGSFADAGLVPAGAPNSLGVSWSPGAPTDPGHQNHWNSASVTLGNTGGGVAYDPPFAGIYWLIRIQ